MARLLRQPVWRLAFLGLTAFFSSTIVGSSIAIAGSGYNEIFDESGQIRPEYQMAHQLWKNRNADAPAQFLSQSRQVFHGDNALDSMPRLILDTDYEVLKKGVDQRARAIRSFLKDHYSGEKLYARSGILPQSVVDRIIARNGESGYQNQVNPDTLSFFYGPDIIRDSAGNWRVIEDNIGFVGGIGDLSLAQSYMLKTYPELKSALQPRQADDFYIKVAESFKARAQQYGGKAVLLTIPEYAADNEDKRISKIFAGQGILTVTPNSSKRLRFTDDRVYLDRKTGSGKIVSEPVGFIFLNGEHAWMDPSHPAAVQKNIIEEASDMLRDPDIADSVKTELAQVINAADPKTHVPDFGKLKSIMEKVVIYDVAAVARRNKGLIEAMLKNKVGSNYTPGIDFVGDKEFYVYVEDLIRLYLQEEPLIHNIDTQKFNVSDSNTANENLISKVLSDLPDYVIKKVDGRGGDSVWVGPKLKDADIPALLEAIRKNPDLYIVQKFTALSTLNNNIVDLRVLTSVSPDLIIVTDTPWGRGLPEDGNGKVNLSDQGREVAVLVIRMPLKIERSCRSIFQTIFELDQ